MTTITTMAMTTMLTITIMLITRTMKRMST